MNKKYLFSISLLISLLIILIPIAVAKELDTYDNLILKTKEQRINLYQSSEEEVTAASADREPFERDYLSDPGKACVSQHEETSKYANKLDSGVISTLKDIASILFAICTTMSAVDAIISAVAMGIGMISGDFCCTPQMMVCPGPCGAPCTAMSGIYKGWSRIYSLVRPLCCFVNCGWCMGAKTGDTCWGLPFGLEKLALPSYIPDLGISAGLTPEGKRKGGIGQFGISPYDNIYTAIGCLCPVAIIFNLRKLKTIYDVYDCCIQEACENGLSTESCEKQLDEATCMYYEGSLYSMLAKVLVSLIVSLITKVLFQNLVKDHFLEGVIMCAYAVFKLTEIPKVIDGVTSAWDYMDRSFDKPVCKDLSFDEIKDDIEYDWIDLTIVDRNKDGIYDYYAKIGKESIPATIVANDNAFEWSNADYDDEYRYYYDDKGKIVGRYEFKTETYEKFDNPLDPDSLAAPPSPKTPLPSTSIISGDDKFEWIRSDYDNDFRYYYNENGKVVGRYNFNSKEYEKFDKPVDKAYASAPSFVPTKKGPIKSLKTGLKQNYENEAVKMVMYDMIWGLLDHTLGEKVDEWVEDKCKEDYKASYPPQDTPIDSGGPTTCEGINNNIYNAQFISKTELDNECRYAVSYALAACNHEINFVVQLQGTSSNENIEGGTLALGQTLSSNRIITSSLCTHQRICIIIKGEGVTKCFLP